MPLSNEELDIRNGDECGGGGTRCVFAWPKYKEKAYTIISAMADMVSMSAAIAISTICLVIVISIGLARCGGRYTFQACGFLVHVLAIV